MWNDNEPVHESPNLFPQQLASVHEQRVRCSRYWYRAIATNLDQDDWDDHQIMRFDNQQTEASENHLKASRRDFSAVRAVNHPIASLHFQQTKAA